MFTFTVTIENKGRCVPGDMTCELDLFDTIFDEELWWQSWEEQWTSVKTRNNTVTWNILQREGSNKKRSSWRNSQNLQIETKIRTFLCWPFNWRWTYIWDQKSKMFHSFSDENLLPPDCFYSGVVAYKLDTSWMDLCNSQCFETAWSLRHEIWEEFERAETVRAIFTPVTDHRQHERDDQECLLPRLDDPLIHCWGADSLLDQHHEQGRGQRDQVRGPVLLQEWDKWVLCW